MCLISAERSRQSERDSPGFRAGNFYALVDTPGTKDAEELFNPMPFCCENMAKGGIDDEGLLVFLATRKRS
jgi:hypothetical protein